MHEKQRQLGKCVLSKLAAHRGGAVELLTPRSSNLEQCPARGGAEASYDARAGHRIARSIWAEGLECQAFSATRSAFVPFTLFIYTLLLYKPLRISRRVSLARSSLVCGPCRAVSLRDTARGGVRGMGSHTPCRSMYSRIVLVHTADSRRCMAQGKES